MSMMHSQINIAISTALAERVISEIQNIVSSWYLQRIGTLRQVRPIIVRRLLKETMGVNLKLQRRTHSSPYMVTGATDIQRQFPELLTGRIHSHPNLETQESTHNVSLDRTLPAPETEVPETPQDLLNRLAEVLVSLQNKPQSMTIRPVTTTPMTFDGKSEKFELFEDLFHTMIKMQPVMTEQMKINHFHSLQRKGALQTFRNINTINRQTLEDVLVKFRRKYVKPESQATAKHKWHRLLFDIKTMKLPDFVEELNQGAEKAFG